MTWVDVEDLPGPSSLVLSLAVKARISEGGEGGGQTPRGVPVRPPPHPARAPKGLFIRVQMEMPTERAECGMRSIMLVFC